MVWGFSKRRSSNNQQQHTKHEYTRSDDLVYCLSSDSILGEPLIVIDQEVMPKSIDSHAKVTSPMIDMSSSKEDVHLRSDGMYEVDGVIFDKNGQIVE
jgi:hypothetical protein